jgi:hypothetical protein
MKWLKSIYLSDLQKIILQTFLSVFTFYSIAVAFVFVALALSKEAKAQDGFSIQSNGIYFGYSRPYPQPYYRPDLYVVPVQPLYVQPRYSRYIEPYYAERYYENRNWDNRREHHRHHHRD